MLGGCGYAGSFEFVEKTQKLRHVWHDQDTQFWTGISSTEPKQYTSFSELHIGNKQWLLKCTQPHAPLSIKKMTEITQQESLTSKTLEASGKLTQNQAILVRALKQKAEEAYKEAHKEGNKVQEIWNDGYVTALLHVLDNYGWLPMRKSPMQRSEYVNSNF